jgi:hypothetical protein
MAGRYLSDAQRRGLHYVKAPKGKVDLGRFPDFLIVGPQRTGTTWLHANLREHPEIFLAEPKELFFFSRLKTPDHPKFQSNDLGWYLGFFHDPLWRYLYKQAMCMARYRRAYNPMIRGEATASYAAMDREVIEELALLRPDVKVIMMVRDPVERAWSHAKKDLSRNVSRPLSDVTDDEWQAFFRDPYQVRCAQYGWQFENWSACLPSGNILVAKFEDVAERPEALLAEVLRFLGVSSEAGLIPASARKPVNPTGPSKVPDQHRRFLEQFFAAEIADWRRRFG